jgi:hypothetical protein
MILVTLSYRLIRGLMGFLLEHSLCWKINTRSQSLTKLRTLHSQPWLNQSNIISRWLLASCQWSSQNTETWHVVWWQSPRSQLKTKSRRSVKAGSNLSFLMRRCRLIVSYWRTILGKIWFVMRWGLILLLFKSLFNKLKCSAKPTQKSSNHAHSKNLPHNKYHKTQYQTSPQTYQTHN